MFQPTAILQLRPSRLLLEVRDRLTAEPVKKVQELRRCSDVARVDRMSTTAFFDCQLVLVLIGSAPGNRRFGRLVEEPSLLDELLQVPRFAPGHLLRVDLEL